MKKLAIFFLIYFLQFTTNNCLSQITQYPFTPNLGQWEDGFEFRSDLQDLHIFGMKNGIRFEMEDPENRDKLHTHKHENNQEFTLKYHVFDMQFIDANTPTLNYSQSSSFYYNYFIGSDSAKWKSEVHAYSEVNMNNVWEGIDMRWYLSENKIKYDWIVKPTGNAENIKLQIDGADKIKTNAESLIIRTSVGDYEESKPIAYQIKNGEKIIIPCRWYFAKQVLSFDFPEDYDHSIELIIDPTLVFCSYTGSTSDNWGMSATYDSLGNFYLGSITIGNGFPTSTGAFQSTYGGGSSSNIPGDISISKYSPNGNTLIYGTYIGGSLDEFPHSLIVDGQNLIIAGRTSSSNYPVLSNAYDPTFNGNFDFYITKLNSTGTALLGSTFLGGSGLDATNVNSAGNQFGSTYHLKFNYGDESRSEVNVDQLGNIYLAGSTQSNNFPFTYSTPATKGVQNCFAAKFNSSLSALTWCGNYGGNNYDAAYVINIDKSNNFVYIAGGTESNNLSMGTPSLQSNYNGNIDGFITKIDNNNGNMVTTTYLGTGAYDQIYGIQIDDSNYVYVTGQTRGAWPITNGVFSNPNSAQFIEKLSPSLNQVIFSTVYGDGQRNLVNLSPVAFLVDTCGNIFVSGWGGEINIATISNLAGYTNNLPITSNAFQSSTDGSDFYFIVLSKNAQSLRYGSYFGQNGGAGEHVDGGTSRFNKNGQIYQAICANCTGGNFGFPVTPGAYSMTNNSNNCNAAAVKINFEYTAAVAQATANPNTSGCVPFTVNFANNSLNSTSYFWDFGDGNTSTAVSPTHIYTTPGTYTPYLAVYNPQACIERDTIYLNIVALNDSIRGTFNLTQFDSCTFTTVFFNQTVSTLNPNLLSGLTMSWNFGDGTSFTGPNPPPHIYNSQNTYTVTLTVTHPNACNSPLVITKSFTFSSSAVEVKVQIPDSLCIPEDLVISNNSINGVSYAWDFGDGTTSTLASPVHSYAASGNYLVTVIAYNSNTCNKSDTFSQNVEVGLQPTADFFLTPFPYALNEAIYTHNTSTHALDYLWEFGDGTTSTLFEPTHQYAKTGTYTICLTAKNKFCKDSLCRTMSVEIRPLIDITTGFTPNNDHINDYVEVNGYAIESFTLKIFNRWGELVYNETRKETGKTWDGFYKNQLQEQDAFAYILNATFTDGTTAMKKGNITLIK